MAATNARPQAADTTSATGDVFSPDYSVAWGAVSLLVETDDKNAPRYNVPKDADIADGFARIPKGQTVSAANRAGAEHLFTWSNIGALRPTA